MKKSYLLICSLSLILFSMSNCFLKKQEHLDFLYGGDDAQTYSVSTGDTNLVRYYTNLTNNFGNNFTQSSCGYVALGMLLTYYDALVNDNIVPDAYDRKANYSTIRLDTSTAESPGSEFDSLTSFSNPQAYWDYLYLKQNSNLHAKLAIIGTTYLGKTSNLQNLEYKDIFGTHTNINLYTLETYLQSLSTTISYEIEYKAYDQQWASDINCENYEQVFSFIKMEIDAGRPVLIGFDGHARIAYHYEFRSSMSDYKIYLHEGYVDSFNTRLSVHDNLNLEYLNGLIHQGSTHISAISLRLDSGTPQSPGHNYHSQVFNDDNSYFLDYANHNSHVYVYDYSYLNNNYHLRYCKCMLNQQELHAYRIDIRYDEEYCMCSVENPYYNDFGILIEKDKEEEYEE